MKSQETVLVFFSLNMETRVTVLGGGGVGKSCLTIRYTLGHYEDKYDATVEDTYRKGTMIDGKAQMVLILVGMCVVHKPVSRDTR